MNDTQSNVVLMMPPDPLRNQGVQDLERAFGPKNDPERPPVKEPGEKATVVGAIIGALAGAAAGVVLAAVLKVGNVVINLAAGVIIFGIAGAFVGGRAGKPRRS